MIPDHFLRKNPRNTDPNTPRNTTIGKKGNLPTKTDSSSSLEGRVSNEPPSSEQTAPLSPRRNANPKVPALHLEKNEKTISRDRTLKTVKTKHRKKEKTTENLQDLKSLEDLTLKETPHKKTPGKKPANIPPLKLPTPKPITEKGTQHTSDQDSSEELPKKKNRKSVKMLSPRKLLSPRNLLSPRKKTIFRQDIVRQDSTDSSSNSRLGEDLELKIEHDLEKITQSVKNSKQVISFEKMNTFFENEHYASPVLHHSGFQEAKGKILSCLKVTAQFTLNASARDFISGAVLTYCKKQGGTQNWKSYLNACGHDEILAIANKAFLKLYPPPMGN